MNKRRAVGALAILTSAACGIAVPDLGSKKPNVVYVVAPTATAPPRSAAPCDVLFCDDFERESVVSDGGPWTNFVDDNDSGSIDDHAYTGFHSLKIASANQRSVDAWLIKDFGTASNSVELTFAMKAPENALGSGESVAAATFSIATPASDVVFLALLQYEGQLGLSNAVSVTAQAYADPTAFVPLPTDWHVIDVKLDIGQKTATLAVDDQPPVSTTLVLQHAGELPQSEIGLGVSATKAGVAFEDDFDDIRLDVK